MSDPDRFRALDAYLDQALDLPASERAAWLTALRAEDPLIASEIAQLLDDHRALEQRGFLAAPGSAASGGMLPTDPPAGAAFGPYTLVALLGEGGMGQVWLAEQTEPVRRQVAIKILKFGMDTAQVVARFEIERQMLALMEHSAVARVYDAGATPAGRPYFVMEYVRGAAITEHCDRHRLTTRERLDLFRRVCDGVQHAHQKAILHRDLKPSNVLVTEEDGRPVPKIIDFGIAKATGARVTDHSLHTRVDAPIGTPEYMSPEQAEGGRDIDTRTDVYSLGVMLYELLVGTRPFDSELLRQGGPDEIRRRIREEQPKKPSTRLVGMPAASLAESAARRRVDPATLRRQIRGDLDWIVMKAIEKDRERRYDSAAALASDIGRYLEHLPVLAGPPGPAYRTAKFVRRHRVGVGFAAVGVLGLAAFAGVMTIQSARIARERDRAAHERDLAARERDRANREAITSRRALAVLTDLFQVSDPSEARGGNITAREILDRGAGKIDQELADEPAVRATLLMTLGEVYRSLGLYESARPLVERALQLRRGLPGGSDDETADTLNLLGSILQDEGHFPEAEQALKQALEMRRKTLGPDDPKTVASINNVGLILKLSGRLADAEPYLKEALAASQRLHPSDPDDEDILMGRNNLGLLLLDESKATEAEPYLRQTADGCRRTMGNDHPHTLTAISNLALVLQREGRPAEAEPLNREVLATRRRVLGDDHPQTLLSDSLLGAVLSSEGRYDEAAAEANRAVEGYRRTLGPDHVRTLMALYGLGRVRQAQGRSAEAERILRPVLTGREKAIGADHYDTLDTLLALGSVLQDEGKFPEAEAMLHDAVERSRGKLGPDHPATLDSLSALGDVYVSEGRLREAEALEQQVVATVRRLPPAGLRLNGTILSRYGRCLTGLGRYPEAERILLEARDLIDGSSAAAARVVEKNLADLHARWSPPDRG